jgi:hypothetical protein
VSPSLQDQNLASSTQGALYGKLRDDIAISNGAFRLWHVLKGMAGPKGYCWPGQRELAKNYHWSIHSLKGWIQQLVDRGYLRVEKPDREKYPDVPPRYNGVVYVPACTVAETGHSTVAQTDSKPCPKVPTGAVSSISNGINKRELRKENQVKDTEFLKPSLKEIESNFLKDNSTVEQAKKFYDHYEGKNWMIGKSKMKFWRHFAASWRKKRREWDAQSSKNGNTPEQAGKVAKTETDETAYRFTEDGILYEFDANHAPPAGTAHWLAWSNWKARPEAYRKTV